MAKVYICEEGMWSDRKIMGAFSTSELAAAFRARGIEAGRDMRDVKEYELDKAQEFMREGQCGYWVRMWRDGDSRVSEIDDYERMVFATSHEICRVQRRIEHGKRVDVYALEVNVVAESEEGAVKIANEIRTQLIANNQWPEVGQ